MKQAGIVVGTRGSTLAQWQTRYVIGLLEALAPDLNVQVKIIKTFGDQDQQRSLAEFDGLGIFTKAIEDALLAGTIDLAVHSLKDLPTEISPDLVIAAYPRREDPRDCLVSRHRVGIRQLAPGARVGTSSARRGAQVRAIRPDAVIVPLRGNVDTRLTKAQTLEYDAVVVAAAGLIRLGKQDQITEFLSIDDVLPDPGQGALAVEVRKDDPDLYELVHRLDDIPTRHAVTAERAFLKALGGGCRLPIGAFSELKEGQLELAGMVANVDSDKAVRGKVSGGPELAQDLGAALAIDVLTRGASDILSMRPLQGKRILITRAKDQARQFSEKIRSLGGMPIEFPVIEFAPVENSRELDDMLREPHDWIVCTSANGVQAISDRLNNLGIEPALLSRSKLAAIGPTTADAIKDMGLPVSFVPTRFLGDQIARELPIQPGECALLLRADLASDSLARGLEARGVRVHDVDAYRTVRPSSASVDIDGVDVVTFTSSSTVRNFVEMIDGQKDILTDAAVICIGPVTAATARELGIHVDAVAEVHTVDGLLACMLTYFHTVQTRVQGTT